MKLNLGCGGDYKEGYINADAFDKTVADKIMFAYDLKFDDNSFDEIYLDSNTTPYLPSLLFSALPLFVLHIEFESHSYLLYFYGHTWDIGILPLFGSEI